MLQFSANLSLLFTELDLSERFQAAKLSGFDAVEIQFPYQLPAEQIRQLLDQHQLELVLFNIAADDLLQGGEGLASVPEKKQQFKQALEQCKTYAEVLHPAAINVLPGRCQINPKRKSEYLSTFIDNLLLALETFRPLGIKTVFEAINTVDMADFLIHSSQQMLDILQQLQQSGLYIQYDIYHMAQMGEDYTAFILNHAEKIGHIQFADQPGRHQPGTGKIDFHAVFNAIDDSTYSGWLGAEYIPKDSTIQSLAWLNKNHFRS